MVNFTKLGFDAEKAKKTARKSWNQDSEDQDQDQV